MNATLYFIFRCILAILLCYSSFVSIYISFFKNKQFDFLTLFFTLTLFAFAVFSLQELYNRTLNAINLILNVTQNSLLNIKNILQKISCIFWNWPYIYSKKQKDKDRSYIPGLNKTDHDFRKQPFGIKNPATNKKKWIGLLVLCLISLLIGFVNVASQYHRGVFFDEITQFSKGANNVIVGSYSQQQPPLDYYFSSFSHSLFGNNKFAIRFHAMLFYLVLSLTISLGLWFFCSSLWISALGTGLFLINHVIRLHAVNARPLALALFTGFLFLFFYLSYCSKRQTDKKSLFPVLASQYLFVMSIGLQPVIFIISLFISSFWLFPYNKKQIFTNLFLSNTVTAGLTLPFYLKMWEFGKSIRNFKIISWESINSYIANLDIFYFIEKYFFSFYEQMSLFFLMTLIGFFALALVKKSAEKLTVIILLSALLFPLIYDSVFNIFIFYPWFNDWYIITSSFFLILFVILFLTEINEYLKNKKLAVWLLLSFSILFLINIYNQIYAIKNETRFNFPYKNNTVEKTYDYLKLEGNPKDMAVMFHLQTIASPKGSDFIHSPILYHNPETHPAIIKKTVKYSPTDEDHIYYIDWKNRQQIKRQKIFFITFFDNDTDAAYTVLSHFITGVQIGEYAVFEYVFKAKDKEREYINFLSRLILKTPKKQQPILYETLLYYMYKNKVQIKFNNLLKQYKELEPALYELSPFFNFSNHFILKKRVKYFENLNWIPK